MNKLKAFLLACLAAGTFTALNAEAATSGNSMVRFRLSYGTVHFGDIDVELFDQDRPITVSNFLYYVQSGAYDNSIIHRCDPDFIIQGGFYSVANPYSTNKVDFLSKIPEGTPIPGEYNVGPQHSNTFGTLAMALTDGGTGPNPDSGAAQWFFNIDDNSSILTNYTAFGRVKAGSKYLNFFKTLREEAGIINMYSTNYSNAVYYGRCNLLTIDGEADIGLAELPVAYFFFDCPYYSDLFSVQMIMLNGRDVAPPKITISNPKSSVSVSNSTFTATGTVTDNVAVDSVRIYMNRNTNDPIVATVTNNTWSAVISNYPAAFNHILVEATDTSGNRSTLSTEFFYSVAMPFTLTFGGTRSSNDLDVVTGITNGQLLEIGKVYSMTAKPAPGNVFAGWAVSFGFIVSQNPTLKFQMASNGGFTVVFNTNLFPILKGTYTGLFYNTNAVEERSSGFITLTLGDRGSYSAKVSIEGKTHRMTGAFDSAGGDSANFLSRKGTNDINEVNLRLDLVGGSDRLTGDLSTFHILGTGTNAVTNSWTATLNADRALFNSRTNPAPQAGKYTLLFPLDTNSPAGPGGDGYATATVSTAGSVSLKGELADGTKVAQKVPLSKNGQWPMYLSLYKGKGSIFSWANLYTNNSLTDIDGVFYWFKPGQTAKYYSGGFSNQAELAGSRFIPPSATNLMLNVTNVMVGFTNGNLTADFANNARLDAQGKVTDLDLTNKFKMTISKSSGTFSGSVLPPGAAKSAAFRGAILQKQNIGSGFLLGTNQTGRVSLAP